MWPLLKLKSEEVSYFASQLDAHTKHPALFLFYLSAFLSSARSVTFHVQKRGGGAKDKVYGALRDQLLSDPVCEFFVDLRNRSEKEGYPALTVAAQVAHPSGTAGKLVWTQHASVTLTGPQDIDGLRFIQNYLHDEWDFTDHSGPPARLRLLYKFPDYPGGRGNVVSACHDFADRLWSFIAQFRWKWEQANDPGASRRKFEKSLAPGYELPDPLDSAN